MFAHQPGAATFSESTGQPDPSCIRSSRTPGGTTAAEQDDSDLRRARGHSAVQLGPEHHYPGPVPNLGRGTDVQLAHTAAAGGGGGARTRITDVSRTLFEPVEVDARSCDSKRSSLLLHRWVWSR